VTLPRILVCGGRDLDPKTDWPFIRDHLDDICDERGWYIEDESGNRLYGVVIIHGCAEGADLLADEWGLINWVKIEGYPADWKKYKKAAGPIRNQQMLDEGKPDLVVAFPTKNSRGTWDMVRRAEKAGVPVLIYKH
jgi:hypothetical protein